jgi:hypothetical protein
MVINNDITFGPMIGIVVGHTSVAQRQHSHPFGTSNVGATEIADMCCTSWINPT